MSAAVVEQPRAAVRANANVRSRLSRLIALVAVADTVVIALAVVAALALKFGLGDWPPTEVEWFTGIAVVDFGWIVPVWMAALAVSDAYSRRQFARGTDEFKTVLKGSALALAVVSIVAYLINYDMSRGFFAYAFVIGSVFLLSERYLVRRLVVRLRSRNRLMHRVVAVGDTVPVAELHEALVRQPSLGYQLVGACLPAGCEPLDPDVPNLGRVEDAVDISRSVGADTILVVSGSFGSSVELRRIGWDLEDDDIDLIVVPSLIDVAGPRIHMRPVAGLPFLHVEPPQVARAMRWGKALFDRLASLLLLTALAPVMLAVAIAIKLENGGPVLFRHGRIGVHGREFSVWKFRSMIPAAAASQRLLVEQHAADVLLFKLKSDPRVTRVGRFIRKYSLDELPQLFNVLRGDMSLVGPRPQVADEVAAYDSSTHRRLLVRPGITGLWQVSGRSELSWEESVRLDLYYVDNWSMMGDLVILAKTVRAVLRHDGAY